MIYLGAFHLFSVLHLPLLRKRFMSHLYSWLALVLRASSCMLGLRYGRIQKDVNYTRWAFCIPGVDISGLCRGYVSTIGTRLRELVYRVSSSKTLYNDLFLVPSGLEWYSS